MPNSAQRRGVLYDPAALIETWCAALSGAAPKLLRDLFAFGREVTRAEIAADLGIQPRGGHWNAGWKELRDNGLVTMNGERAQLSELFRSDEVSATRDAGLKKAHF